ncbi:MAG: trigger factor [Candidatus Marinimicrobia bacterium]|nr:trigger factor [Candidatus Neomarinimicrobiota bacterium]MBT3629791.1 trigger factor [Candidatus Neomarinimicrobiota bacterium]MBT3823743.1 trigger factor [Candidatus Neomarinimicrobiota bacterium]MBT4132515.1 trigger factor [Candidatus Neomarinimicrobiota bacterium]MBT4296814.1 trigger factor [Candidatus Neomarinimicrobiota bacterium]
MDIKIEVGKPHERTIKVQVEWSEMEPGFEKKLTKLNKQVNRPGFRPGKIPRKIMLQSYGHSVLAEILDETVQAAYYKGIMENELSPIDQGSIEDMSEFDIGKNLEFSLKLQVEPDFEMFNYQAGFKITKTEYTASDEDIAHALEHLQERFAEVEIRDDGAVDGDLLKGDLQYLNESGEPIEGSHVADRYIKIGDGVFGDKVAKKLIGSKVGDDVTFDIPAQTKEAEDLHIKLQVKAVETHILPELNDEFAKQVDPKFESMDALKESSREDIQKQLDFDVLKAQDQSLANKLVEETKLEVPDAMIDDYLGKLVERVRQERGADVDEDEVREQNRERAIWELSWYLIRKKLIATEKIEVTDEDVELKLDELVAQMPGDQEKMKALYRDKQYLPQIKDDILEKKIFAHIESFAKVKVKKASSKEIGGYHAHAH